MIGRFFARVPDVVINVVIVLAYLAVGAWAALSLSSGSAQ